MDSPQHGQSINILIAHAAGSTRTYLQRYTLVSALGLVIKGADDDGMQGELQKPIDVEQLAEIKRLIEVGKSDIVKFCKFFKLDKIENLTKDKYGVAVSMLNERIKKQNK